MDIVKENENIFRITTPYKDIFTTVYLIKTEKGALLFDCASYDSDIDNYIVPFLNELSVGEVKYVFISHNHTDHSGGLKAFMKKYGSTCIVTRSQGLKDSFADKRFLRQMTAIRFLTY
ncbi:MAG: MBL fold metallo-hydrolase [Clostridia bacterium]|nr:MBL fold metallo-hydrolase [Clostridia bacterium]